MIFYYYRLIDINKLSYVMNKDRIERFSLNNENNRFII